MSSHVQLTSRICAARAAALGLMLALGAALAAVLSLSLATPVAAADVKPRIEIAAGPAGQALKQFIAQTGLQLLFDFDAVNRLTTRPVSGELDAAEALSRMLAGTGLAFEFVNDRTVTVTLRNSGQSPVSGADASLDTDSGSDGRGQAGSLTLAQATQHAASSDESPRGVDEKSKEAAADRQNIQEVIVTAQKRAQNIQDVPMSIAVLGREDIDRRNLVGMDDYLRSVPGVSFVDMGAGQNVTIIRGISADPQWEAFSAGSTVGAYFGEVPLSGLRSSGAADIKLVDMERIEVLRGPQGTLYGSGSLSGTVRNIPVAPNLHEFQGDLKVGYSSTEKKGGSNDLLQGVANIPLVKDVLALRAVGYRFTNSGYIENRAGSDPAYSAYAAAWGIPQLAQDRDDVGSNEYKGGRAALLWKPSDRFNATLTYITQDIDQEGLPEVQLNTGTYQQRRLRFGPVVGGGGEVISDHTEVTNLVLDYDFGWAALLSSSSWNEQEWIRNLDVGDFLGPAPGPSLLDYANDGFSQELRLTSQLPGQFQFLLGAYYEDLDFSGSQDTYFGGDPALNPFGGPFLIDALDVYNIKQRAFFSELSYALTDRLTVAGGVRKFSYDRSTRNDLDGVFFGSVATSTLIEGKEGDTSYKLNVTFKPTSEALLYAQWSQGFRLGRPQSPLPSVCDADADGIIDGTTVRNFDLNIDSDRLDNYEVGAKLTMLDRRVAINAAVYRIDWQGLPTAPINECGFTFFINAGKARSQGVELETVFNVTRQLQINVGGSYVKAELGEDAPNLGARGDRLPGSPEFNASIGAQYDFELAAYPAYVRGDYAYVGGFYNNLQQLGTEAGDYSQVNMKLEMAIHHFDIGLFVNNLTDEDALTWLATQFIDTRAYRLRPRTIGLNVGYRF